MKLSQIHTIILCVVLLLVSCKKDDIDRPTYETDELENLIKDEVFYFTKQQSLWETSLPPKRLSDIENDKVLRDYTKYYKTAEDVLTSLKAFTPIDPNTNKPIDRFSFIDREGQIKNEIQNGVAESFGMFLTYIEVDSKDNADLFVKMVDINSPAAAAGIKRGTQIKSINGNTAIDYVAQERQKFDFINNALNSSSITLVIANEGRPDSSVIIRNTTYRDNSIINYKVIERDDKKIGYLAFNSFINIYDDYGNKTSMYTDFENIFSYFETNNINELIVDLRYNGGGSTYTSEYLADKIIPKTYDGKLMYTYKVNQYFVDSGDTEPGNIFGPVNFSKKGNINLQKVYFLVSKATASASELLINILKPYMNVQLIGAYGENGIRDNTYGKPVGFFEQKLKNNRSIGLYSVSFQMFNSKGYGDYFGGLTPDKHAYEDFFKDFGDPEEGLIAEAMYHIKNNSYLIAKSNNRSISSGNSKKSVPLKSFERNSTIKGMFKFDEDH